MKTILLTIQALLYLVLLGFLLYLYLRNRRFKKIQQQMLAKLEGQRFWRINIARPKFISRFIRIVPYEATGVLIDEGDHFKIKGYWQKNGKLAESTVLKSNMEVHWIGNKTMRSGNLHWAQLKTSRGDLMISADTGMNALRSREGLEDIFRGAFPNYKLSTLETADFALEKNPRTRVAMVVFFSLLMFSLLDTFVISKYELIDSQIGMMLLNSATLAAVLAGFGVVMYAMYIYFIKGNVPARESWVLSTFLTAMVVLSIGPVAKRFDQALAASPSQDYAYRIVDGVKLEPVNASLNLPKLRFPRVREYWAQFDEKHEYSIPLLQGPLGLWQLDHEKFDKPIIDFYQKSKK